MCSTVGCIEEIFSSFSSLDDDSEYIDVDADKYKWKISLLYGVSCIEMQ